MMMMETLIIMISLRCYMNFNFSLLLFFQFQQFPFHSSFITIFSRFIHHHQHFPHHFAFKCSVICSPRILNRLKQSKNIFFLCSYSSFFLVTWNQGEKKSNLSVTQYISKVNIFIFIPGFRYFPSSFSILALHHYLSLPVSIHNVTWLYELFSFSPLSELSSERFSPFNNSHIDRKRI